ncbi:MAG: PAS domain S-box protein [Gemmatimonadetes bacterium]|nr:PAS domain S-box protein [Gemmatimonadota bacterium]
MTEPAAYHFNPFAIPPLIAAVLLALIAAWVLIRERASPVSRAFGLVAAVVCVWQITKSLMYLSTTPESAMFWARVGYLGVPFIGPGMYYFSTHLLRVSARRRFVSGTLWAIGAGFSVAIVAGGAVLVGVQRYSWGFYPRWDASGLFFLAFFSIAMGLAAREFWLQYRQAGPGVYRRRIRALLVAFLIANGGAADYLGVYGIEVYPAGYLAVFAFLALAGWAVVRYGLVDLTPSFAAEQILSTMADPLIVLDGSRRIRIVNEAVREVFGFERAELIGQPATLLTDGDETAARRLTQLCAVDGVRDEQMKLYARDGTPVEVSVSTSHVGDEEGATVGTVLIARDMRERKAVENALRESEERFRALIQNISDVIVVLDADLNVSFVSASARRVLGYTAQEHIGTSALTLIHPEDVAAAQRDLAALAEPGTPGKGETRVRHFDGSWRTVEATATNLLHDPAVNGIIIVYQDVTERKAAEAALRASEEQLRQSQRMEAVGRLAGGVAHDFNNLLTVINGETLLLLETPPADPEVRLALEEVLRAGNRAGDLTRQLLAFSRRLVLQPKMLDLNLVITDLEKMLRRLIGEDVKLGVALEPNLGKVKADPGQIEQVILNLVVNARDAMPRGGVLSIETRNVASVDAPGVKGGEHGFVSVSVRDTGIGMDEATVQRIFEPFFTTKEQGKGTGLGLSTVYGIVEQSGGSVQVESRPGAGAVFRVLLPRAEEEAGTGPQPPGLASPAGGTETVLLVEDDGSVRALTQTILQRCGYKVLAARNGAHALRLCEEAEGRIDLLITDVVMPGMGGRELAETLSDLHPCLRVLYMSGYTDDAILRHGVEGGMAFLPKPFTPAEMAQTVRQMLDVPASPGVTADR